MPYDFHNQLYSQGTAGFVDFIWLWYNRISIIIAFAILIIAVIIAVLTYLQSGQNEGFRASNNKRRGGR